MMLSQALKVTVGTVLWHKNRRQNETVTSILPLKGNEDKKGYFPMFTTDKDTSPNTYRLFLVARKVATPVPTHETQCKTLFCADCGIPILIEGPMGMEMPVDPILCQKCDPGFASLLDNKYHKPN